MNENRYLIAIDIDGTLRWDDGTISDFSKETIRKLKEKGNIVIICTARPRYHAEKVNKEVGASQYIICLNGAEIYDTKKKNYLFESFLDKREILGILEYAKKKDIRMMFNIGTKEYVTKFTRNSEQILLTEENEHVVLEKPVKECMIIDSNKEKIKQFENYIISRYQSNVIVSSYAKEEAFLVVVAKGISKGTSLKKLREFLQIAKQQVISFGNDRNDISMFKESGVGVAVGNATKELLKVATEKTLTNNEDGVAVYLKKLR